MQQQRRRFFPSRGTQIAPGQRVSLEAFLRPDAPPPPAPAPEPAPAPAPSGCVCDTPGPTLLPDWAGGMRGLSQDGAILNAPVWRDWRLLGGAVGIMYSPHMLRAVLPGVTTCNVRWEWALDMPDLPDDPGYPATWGGVQVLEQDGTLSIVVLGGDYMGYEPWHATLRLRAFCGGQDMGGLYLRMGFATDWSSLPPEEGL